MPRTSQESTSDSDPLGNDELPTGSQEAYDRFLPLAEKIPEDEVRYPRVDVNLARVNGSTGASVVLEHTKAIRTALPDISIKAIEDLVALGLALAFADLVLERHAPPESRIRTMLARANKLRALLLGAAQNLVLAGILEGPVVKKIREGTGAFDTAGDLVALAALFGKNAEKVHGKVAFTEADVVEAAELGSRLLVVLRPDAATAKPAPAALAAATLARNRMWTLYERTWEDNVWRSGTWLFRRAVDEHVPPLGARVATRREAEQTGQTGRTVESDLGTGTD